MLSWMKDEKVERRLQKFGVKYEYVASLPVSKINIKAGRRNNTRLYGGNIDEDLALQYAIAMGESEACFPACVLIKNGTGFDVEDGNNRFYGMELAGLLGPKATVSAYVIKTKEAAEKALVMRSLNVLNGKPLHQQERIDHCLELLKDFPGQFTQVDLAKFFGVKVKSISDAKRVNVIASKLDGARIKTHKLTKTTILNLGRLAQNEDTMIQAAALAEEYGLTIDEVSDLVTATLARKSEKKQLEYLEGRDTEFSETRNVKPTINKRFPDREKALKCMATLNQILGRNPGGLRIKSSSTRAQARHLWTTLKELGDKAFGK